MADYLISVLIDGKDHLSKAAESAGGAMKGLGNIVGGALTVGFGAAVVGVGALTAVLADSVKGAMDAENITAELNAVLKSTGGVSGMTAESINDIALSLSKVTRFEDDSIVKGEAMLLTFTGIGKDVFPMATEAMLNMAQKFGSMDAASVQLGKALNDPIAGVSALRKVGVALTDAQEAQIKKFVETGDVASAQKVILGELETEFGGLARAAGETLAGRMDILNNRIGNVKDAVGAALIPVMVTLMEKAVIPLLPLVEKLGENFIKLVDKLAAGGNIADVLNLPPVVTDAIKSVTEAMGKFGEFWAANGPGITATVAELGAKLAATFNGVVKDAVPFVTDMLAQFGAWFVENGPLIQKFVKVMADRFADFASAVAGAWKVIEPALDGLFKVVLGLAKLIMQVATGDWKGAWETIKKIVSDAWEGIKKTASAFGDWVASWVGTTMEEIKKTWQTNWDMLVIILKQVWENIKKSISDALSAVGKVISDAWDEINKKATEAWAAIGKVLLDALDAIDKLVKAGLELVRKTIQTAWDFITSDIGTKWAAILGAISDALTSIGNAISGAFNNFVTIITGVWTAIRDGVAGWWTQITTAISTAIAAIPAAVAGAVATVVAIGASIVTAIAQGIADLWEAAGGVVTTLFDFLSGLVDAVWSGELYLAILAIGTNIVTAIQSGLTMAWNAATGIVATLSGKFSELFQALVDGKAFDAIAGAGDAIVDAIMDGIEDNWDAFVVWLKGLIGSIFGGGTPPPEEGASSMSAMGMSAMMGRSGATYNLYVSTTAPVSTIIQDFGMLQSLAGV